MVRKIEILIVEDSNTQAEKLKYILANEHFIVKHAGNGEEALEMLKEDWLPQLIISDVVMPRMDGYSFCAKVKAEPKYRWIPFILLTSLSDTSDVIRGLHCGANSFLTKPFDRELLLEKIEYLLLNFKYRQEKYPELVSEVHFKGNEVKVNSDRLQVLDLFISSYESAFIKNKELNLSNNELQISRNKLSRLSKDLEKKVKLRTAELEEANKNLSVEIEERILAQERQNLTVKILSILNRPNDWPKLINDILFEIKENIGIEAVSLRLKKGDEYPDFVSLGVLEQVENNTELVDLDSDNRISLGDCLCNYVASGSAENVNFSQYGSFCSNDINQQFLLSEKCLCSCDKCKFPNYKSVALIPVLSKNRVIGLFQLKDSRPDFFSPGMLSFLEEIAEAIGVGFIRFENELKIKESEKHYRLFFETAPNLILAVDTDGKIMDCNKQVLPYLGYTAEELIGTPAHQLFLNIHPDEVAHYFNSVKNKEFVYNKEYALQGKNGKNIIANINSSAVKDSEGIHKHTICMINDITSQKKMENELVESREQYKKLFNGDLTGDYIISSSGEITMCNPAFASIFGFPSVEAAIGKNISALYKNRFDYNQKIEQLKSFGKVIDFQTWMIHLDGSKIHVTENSFASFDKNGDLLEITGYMFDDTKRKIAEEEVLRERTLLRIFIDNIPDVILVKDAQGRVLIANHAISMLTGGLTETDAIGKTALELYSGEMGKAIYDLDMKIINEKRAMVNDEEYYELSDGTELWLLVTKIPLLNEKGEVTRLVGIGRDVTKIIKTNEELKTALEKSQIADRLKSSFLATMSHELRTPLNAIIGFSDLIDESQPIETIMEFKDTISSSALHLLGIIETILNFSLIETGVLQLNSEAIDPGNLSREAMERLELARRKYNKESNIEIELKAFYSEDKYVLYADREKLVQVFNTLFDNALKFTSSGKIEFGYKLVSNKEKKSFEFFVKDTGIGISPEMHEVIFEMFRQVEDSNSRRYGGVGLGLSMCKKLVEGMNGDVWLESALGEGATFYFTIPAVLNEDSFENIELIIEKSGEKTILVAEDDDSSYLLLEIYLQNDSVNVLRARNGIEAVDICNKLDIDLVLMDISLPELNGHEATAKLKELKPNLPIIIQSAYALERDRLESRNAGCDDFISKPVQKAVLYSVIQKYLGDNLYN